MRPEQHQHANAIFLGACELAPNDIPAFVKAQCGDDEALQQRVFALLAADARTDAFLESPRLGVEAGVPESIVGERGYRLLRRLGSGGMGEVHLAERSDGEFRHKVAIKLMHSDHRLGRDGLLRFRAERQILASLNHPNIGRLLDGGTLSNGVPFLVMEYVEGERLDEWCRRRTLDVRERLALFLKVCDAVQLAHQSLIVHRDLKPSNILVTDQGEPKLLDFGIAKVLNADTFAQSFAQTHTGRAPMTLAYASPEQVRGDNVGTTSDVYSLGVVLYELLTGSLPYRVPMSDPVSLARAVCEDEPDAPSRSTSRGATAGASTRAPSAPERRAAAAQDPLRRELRGDLDAIVLKALRKESGARYGSVEQMAADIRRYLDGRPVLAAPPSASYRFGKFVRRHKVAVSAGLLVAASLLVGIVAFAWQARIAGQRSAELEQVSKFQAEMLAQVDPTHAGVLLGADVMTRFEATLAKEGVAPPERAREVESFARHWQRVNTTDVARELIDRTILSPAVKAIDRQFADQPLVDAALRQALADLYTYLGSDDAAMPLQQRALETRRALLGNEHPDTLTSISDMGSLLMSRGQLTEAEPYYREALDVRRRVLGKRDPATLQSIQEMGLLLQAQGKVAEAEPYYRQALELRREVLGELDPYTINSINNMGFLLRAQGKLAEAEPFYRDALEKSRRVLGEEHRDTLASLNNMGGLLLIQGDASGAEPYFREAVEKYRRVLGEEHPHTLNALSSMGYLLHAQGKLSEAQPYLEEALEKRRRVLGETHPDTLMSVSSTAALRVAQGRHADAVALLAPAEEEVRTAFTGTNAFRLAKVLLNLGRALASQGDFSRAESKLLEAHAIFVESPGPLPKDRADCVQAIVDLYTTWHAAQPDLGYSPRAAEWERKLEEFKE